MSGSRARHPGFQVAYLMTDEGFGRSFFMTFDLVIAKSKVNCEINAKNLYTDRLKCAPG
ncbi:hypothetical protein EMIT0215P_110052 [Pseudomonas serboccidentalis]